MPDRWTNDPTRNASARTTHDPTAAQGGGGAPPAATPYRMLLGVGLTILLVVLIG